MFVACRRQPEVARVQSEARKREHQLQMIHRTIAPRSGWSQQPGVKCGIGECAIGREAVALDVYLHIAPGMQPDAAALIGALAV